MGRTYVPRNAAIKDFDLNFAGCRIIGLICAKIKFLADYGEDELNHMWKDPPWYATKEESKNAATRLEEVPTEEWREIYKIIINDKLFSGSFEKFLIFLAEWVIFLKQCDGYSTL